MKFSVAKLRGRIIEVFGTIDSFAEKADCSRAFVSSYLNHKSVLNQKTIVKWAGLLNLSDNDIPIYFFTLEVDEMEQGA